MSRPRVLIVDDSPSDQHIAERFLAGDYEVRTAGDPDTGLELCKDWQPECVLLDQCLRNETGLEALPRFLHLNAAVIMLTGHGDEDLAVSSLQHGAHDYLSKRDLSRERLRSAISYAVDKSNLERENDLYRKLIELSPIAAFIFEFDNPDDPGSYRMVWRKMGNDAINRRLREAGKEPIGLTIRESFPELLETGLPGMLRNALRTGHAQILSEFRYGDDPERDKVYDLTAMPLSNSMVGIYAMDVSERVQARENQRRTEEQLRAAQRLEAVGRLAGGVAHDFNNVLTIIQSHADFLRDQTANDPVSRADLQAIMDAARRAERLTAQLLAISRSQSQKLRTLDLNEVTNEMRNMLDRLLGDDIDLICDLEDELASIRADRAQIEQIFLNLVVNARDAMPDGGRLSITTRNVSVTTPYVDMWNNKVTPGAYVMLAVEDTGSGIDPLHRERVFEPFFTTKPEGKGTGLGLSTIHGILSQSGGHIWLDTDPNEGTRFKLYFPMAEDLAVPAEASPLPDRKTSGAETVMLVEDEVPVLNAARRILAGDGYKVLVARSPAGALHIAQQHSRPIDLLVTDVVMPVMKGPELARKLRELQPGLKILFMSGFSGDTIFPHWGNDPCTSFLQKPFTRKALLLATREALETMAPATDEADPALADQG